MQRPTVVQIFRKNHINYRKIIEKNQAFLTQVNVEYFVYDTLDSFEILDFMKNFPTIRYVRKSFKNLKAIFLECALLANNPKVIFLNSEDRIDFDNAEQLELERPSFYKAEIQKVSEIRKDNFKFSEFKDLMEGKYSFLDRLKNIFSTSS
jgi:hypothetical protein